MSFTVAMSAVSFAHPVGALQDAGSTPPAIGILGGVSSAKMVLSGEGVTVTFDSRTGFVGGISLTQEVGAQGAAFVEVDGLYMQKGFQVVQGGEAASVSIDYLQIPVQVGYRLGSAETIPFLTGGVSIGAKVSCTAGVAAGGISISEACGDDVNQVDYGLLFGAGLSSGSLAGAVRYYIGQADVLGQAGVSTKNRVLAFLVSYEIGGS